MRWFSSRVGTLLLAASAMALGACADHPKPAETVPPVEPNPLIIFGGGGGGDEDPPPPPAAVIAVTRRAGMSA